MKSLFFVVGLWMFTAVTFFVGLVSGQTVPVLVAFCAWTPVTFAVGFAAARSGIRITTASEMVAPPRRSAELNGRQPMRRRAIEVDDM